INSRETPNRTIEDLPDKTVATLIYENNVNAYMAGKLEGYITGGLIHMHNLNTIDGFCAKRKQFCDALKTFYETNTAFIDTMIESHANDDYWHQLGLVYDQLRGLGVGYADWKADNNVTNTVEMDVMSEVWWLNIMFESYDLEAILTPNSTTIEYQDHCSAMVKVLPEGSDLYVAHNSWIMYDMMLRVHKQYSFAFKSLATGALIPGHSVAMSSYPGLIFSGDDYYVLSSGRVVQETTNNNYNKSLYSTVRPNQVVLEFARNVVANRLATGGGQWSDIFGRYNSVTYNNQFMIVDYKLFTKGTPVHSLTDNSLWVCEQMPGTMTAADMTKVLRDTTYWGSYNVPYNETARALIFHRDHNSVTDLNALYSLMRSNDFQHDFLSQCHQYHQECQPGYAGQLAIAARYDLNSPTGPTQRFFISLFPGLLTPN
ncbi:unnamed protein product, partial [Medioppia subpectinata]